MLWNLREGPPPGLCERIITLSTTLLCLPQGALVEEVQALAPDLSEAISYANTMTPEEVEETIDYLLKEVIPSSVIVTDFLFTFEFNTAWQRSCQQHPTSDKYP